MEKEYDGLFGLRRAQSESFDLILMDIMLPAINGLKVPRRLRPECCTPVILLTVRDSVIDRAHGLDEGAADYVTKPFAIEELLARTRAVLRPSALNGESGHDDHSPRKYGLEQLSFVHARPAGKGEEHVSDGTNAFGNVKEKDSAHRLKNANAGQRGLFMPAAKTERRKENNCHGARFAPRLPVLCALRRSAYSGISYPLWITRCIMASTMSGW